MRPRIQLRRLTSVTLLTFVNARGLPAADQRSWRAADWCSRLLGRRGAVFGRDARSLNSSLAASLRCFDKSSLTSASATSLGAVRAWRAFRVEPRLRFSLGDDREDLDFLFL